MTLEFPTTVVLGPGGVKGFLHLGALKFLEENKILDNVKRYVGVSIGSILALYLVCGCDISEIFSESLYTPDFFSEFMNVKDFKTVFDIAKDTASKVGFFSNEIVRNKIKDKLVSKFGFEPTMLQLYQATGLEFVSVTLNLSKERTEVLSYKTHPDMSCIDAVLLSINIPIIFRKLKYNGDIYVDGGLGNPYPIDLYDNNEENILGLYIETTNEDIDESFYVYLSKSITSTMTQLQIKIRSLCSPKCVNVKLQTDIKSTMGTGMTLSQKKEMYSQGYAIIKKFIEDKYPDTFKDINRSKELSDNQDTISESDLPINDSQISINETFLNLKKSLNI